MQSRWENEKVFAAYAEIDFLYFAINEAREDFTAANHGLSPIERMVDAATGFDAARELEVAQRLIKLLNRIIKKKAFIEVDAAGDIEFRAALRGLARRCKKELLAEGEE